MFTTLACSLLLLAGCGEKDSKIAVEGIVYCDEKPIASANIAFVGNDGGAYGTGVTDSQGKFKLRVVPGWNKVAVSKANNENIPPPDPNADQSMPTEGEVAVMMKKAPKPLVAERFADPEKSGIVVDVKEGMSPIDINVTSK